MGILKTWAPFIIASFLLIVYCGIVLPIPAFAIMKPPTALGLIGYWSFNEGSGTVATDFSGNENNGSIVGTTWTNGKRGKALNFDGADDTVVLPSSSVFIPGTAAPITMSAWFKADDIPALQGASRIIGFHRLSTAGSAVTIAVGQNNKLEFFRYNSGWSAWTSNISTGTWYHLVLVYDGTSFQKYLDGKPEGAPVAHSLVAGGSYGARIGTYDSTTNEFDGIIDEVRVYNRALSAAEVEALYNSGAVRIGGVTQSDRVTNGLVGYWSFNGPDITDDQILDASGNGNHGGFFAGATSTAKVGGKVGQALQFNGATYVNAGSSSTLKPTGDITVAGWMRTTNTATRRVMGNRSAAGANNGWELVIVSNKARFQVDADTVQQINSSSNVNTGNWVHVVGVRSGTSLLLYINGKSEGTPSGSLSGDIGTNAGNTLIGVAPVNSTGIIGLLDEVRVYSRALTTSEIKELYQIGIGAKIRPGL